jgi:hypothetical protein
MSGTTNSSGATTAMVRLAPRMKGRTSMIFAFNHDEATRSFQRAAELDPRLAMAHWGMALALGANYILPAEPDREKSAYAALQKALALAAKAPEQGRAYIEALAKRYSPDPNADLKQLAVDYKQAMGELAKRYPDDSTPPPCTPRAL